MSADIKIHWERMIMEVSFFASSKMVPLATNKAQE
jgi:hypothetical protein